MKKEMKKKLRYEVLPYPKGTSRRYDTDAPIDLYGNHMYSDSIPHHSIQLELDFND